MRSALETTVKCSVAESWSPVQLSSEVYRVVSDPGRLRAELRGL